MLQQRKVPIVAVMDRGGRFAGYINFENLSELVMVQRTMEDRGGGRA